MLELKVYDGESEVVLQFEHSLLSLSKWEARTRKPFLSTVQKTPMELLDYFGDMLVTPGVDPNVIVYLDPEQGEKLARYMNDIPTAMLKQTPPASAKTAGVTTSEVVYWQLTALEIPWHPAETWHFNRLMTFIQYVSIQRQPEDKKRRNPVEVAKDWKAMNAANREKYKSNG